jgi:hypothetical protein
MTGRVQSLRSNTAGNRPPAGRQPGELYVNWADSQLGSINASNANQDLIAVRYFSNVASYAIGDHVVQAGRIQRAIVAVPPGPFTANQWSPVATMADVTGAYVPVSGGTMTGALILNANPTTALGAAPKQYVDSAVATYLPLTGGALSGNLNGPSANFSGNVNVGSLGVTNGATFTGPVAVPGGQVVITAGPVSGANSVLWFSDGSTNRMVLYFNASVGASTWSDNYSGSFIQMGPSSQITLNAAAINMPNGNLNCSQNAAVSGTLTMGYAQINGTLNVSNSANVAGGATVGGVFGVGNGGGQLYWDGGSYCYHTCPPYSSNIAVGSNITANANSAGNFLVAVGHGYQAGGGSWLALSDERIKTVDSDYTIGLEEVLQLRPVNYTYKGNDTPTADKSALRVEDIDPENPDAPIPAHKLVTEAPYPTSMHYYFAKDKRPFVGLVAQEVEQAFPGMVSEREGFIDGQTVTDMRHLDTTPLIYALVNAVKTLAARVGELENLNGTAPEQDRDPTRPQFPSKGGEHSRPTEPRATVIASGGGKLPASGEPPASEHPRPAAPTQHGPGGRTPSGSRR